MKRRGLANRAIGLVMLGSLVGCTADTADLAEVDDDLLFRSSLVQGHDHTVLIDADYFGLPPEDGVVLETSVDFGHAHAVVLTEDELELIDAGNTVFKETSTDDGHSHIFEFSLVET